MSTRDEAMSPETARRLLAAADRPLKLRKVTDNLAAAATGHRKNPHGTSCETCKEKWPCVDIQRAISPILRAVDDMLDFHDEAARQLAGARAERLEAALTRIVKLCDCGVPVVADEDFRDFGQTVRRVAACALVGDETPEEQP